MFCQSELRKLSNDLAVTTDVVGFIRAHDIALNKYNFDTFIGGDLTRIGTRNDVIVQKECNCQPIAYTKVNQPVLLTIF
jgi:hypothetical protein